MIVLECRLLAADYDLSRLLIDFASELPATRSLRLRNLSVVSRAVDLEPIYSGDVAADSVDWNESFVRCNKEIFDGIELLASSRETRCRLYAISRQR